MLGSTVVLRRSCRTGLAFAFALCVTVGGVLATTVSPRDDPTNALPSWLDDAHPERQLDVLVGRFDADAWLMRHSGLYDRDGPLELRVTGLLDGRLLVGLWTGALGEHEVSGLDLFTFDSSRRTWVLLHYWPAPGDAGFELDEGVFRHGRLELLGQESDAKGRVLDARTTLSDISSFGLRWESQLSADDTITWRTPSVFELSRHDDTRPDLAALLAHDGGALAVARPDQSDARQLLGRWTGRVSRLLDDGRWVDSTCRYEADPLLQGSAILERWHEDAGETGPALERVGLWGHLRGTGRRADRRSWEMFRRDDHDGHLWSFAGDFRADGGDFVCPGERGRLVARMAISHPSDDRLAWVESSTDDAGETWTERVRVELERAP
ncbi:MAG: hypothetical protein H6825_14740 [Planctomycetes bacterium]|nr:hypothetical protein [Planctomycetota bacterium]